MGKNVVDPVGSALRHPSTATRGAKTPASAGKRHENMVIAAFAAQPGEAIGWISAHREALQLTAHEAGQRALAVLQLTKEHRQTFPHDLMKQIASNAACLNGGGHRPRESKDRAV